MDKNLTKQKLAKLLAGIEIGYFDTSKNWGEETNDYYYKYFDDPDPELRSLSLLAFTSMVGNWYHGPADVFYTSPHAIYSPPTSFYSFDDYLSAFLEHASQIKHDFPIMYSYIVYYLSELDKKRAFEHVFPEMDQKLFSQMRTLLFSGEKNVRRSSFNDLLREVGLPTFFSD